MTIYEARKRWLLQALEAYRDTPQGMQEKRLIDKLIAFSRRAAGNDTEERKRHNLIILRYITDTRPSIQRICAALHIGRDKSDYEAETARAVDRLLVLAFGVDGINWNENGI